MSNRRKKCQRSYPPIKTGAKISIRRKSTGQVINVNPAKFNRRELLWFTGQERTDLSFYRGVEACEGCWRIALARKRGARS